MLSLLINGYKGQGLESVIPRANVNSENEATGETLLFHAISQNKNESAKLLLKNQAYVFKKGSNRMNAISACLIGMNHEILSIIFATDDSDILGNDFMKGQQVIDYARGVDKLISIPEYISRRIRNAVVKKDEDDLTRIKEVSALLRKHHCMSDDWTDACMEQFVLSFDLQVDQIGQIHDAFVELLAASPITKDGKINITPEWRHSKNGNNFVHVLLFNEFNEMEKYVKFVQEVRKESET